MRIGCVVLASGDSVRFGENKLLAPFQGKPMVCHVMDRLPRTLNPIWVVTRSQEVAALARERGLAALLHEEPDISDTIRLGLEQMEGVDGCLFCVGDQPLVSEETLGRLMGAFAKQPQGIARACYGQRDGNPALFSKAFFAELLGLQPGQSGGAVMNRHKNQVVRVQAAAERELMDADTPAALRELEALLPAYGETI